MNDIKTVLTDDRIVKIFAEYGVFCTMPQAIECGRAVLAAQSPQVAITVTDEMVKAYLAANDKYWHESDAMPRTSPSKFRNGTPMEATRVSLEAALAALQPQQSPVQKCEHIYEARPIGGSNSVSAPCKAVCRKCGYEPTPVQASDAGRQG